MPLNEGDVIRIALRHRGPQGQDIVNVFHYRATQDLLETDLGILQAFASHFDAAFSQIESYVPATMSPVDLKIDVVQMVNGEEQIVRNVGTIAWGGTLYSPSGSGNVYAPGVAVGILFRTLIGKVFGRKYIGPVMEATLGDHGRLAQDAIGAFVDLAESLLANVVIGTVTMAAGVLSKKLSQFVGFAGYDLAGEAYYQRRRNVKVGS